MRLNAAFDAGYAAALGKPLITLHAEQHDHAITEVDRAALAVARARAGRGDLALRQTPSGPSSWLHGLGA